MLSVAYCDESGDERAFVVSGLLGSLPTWIELERLWRQKLAQLKLPEFHAATCENRRGPFEPYRREQLEFFQREFYGLLARTRLWGFSTAIWQVEYQERRETFRAHR